MSLKTAIFQMKQALMDRELDGMEQVVRELEATNGLQTGALTSYYQQLLMVKKNSVELANQTNDEVKKINRKWTKQEMEFMFQYIKARQDEGALNITEILEEIAQLLNRGYQSVNYKYYTIVKNNAKKQNLKPTQTAIKFATIADDIVPVVATEFITRQEANLNTEVYSASSSQADGLLDILSGLITNIGQLPGMNLNHLLKSLFELTNLALQNQAAVQQINNIELEMNQERQMLQDRLNKAEKQLAREKERNQKLTDSLSLLANEIEAFNNMTDAAKIQNLKAFNQRLNRLIHKDEQQQQISQLI
ncbi:hypothetical protein HHO41_02200 [Bacillus sp. DNRA2]|uniref:hypothetical protein n=1 Tax=Bacillus sp. DNRA2 TaxID=2723053 RepID=UPI00145F0A00|nr:hypothetical protein [Bacillus sp. DNRA2]NMD69084.1 hypothetical protein [Bacillus sp. DNRA2]